MLIIVGVVTFAIPMLASAVLQFLGDRAGHPVLAHLSLWRAVGGAIGLTIGGLLVVRGQRHRVRGAEAALAHEERPTLVYLRPFEADKASPGVWLRSRRRLRLHAGIRRFGRPLTFEQRVAQLVRDVAVMVTFGDPVESLPRLGAARLYAGDDEWQAKVDDLLERGGPIIVHVGDSAGVGWEIDRVVALDQPERVILSLPIRRTQREARDVYARFRAQHGDRFPRGIPADPAETQFLYFDGEWSPHRLEERDGVPAPAAPGSPAGQRALVLRKLAPEFKPMWAPLWIRLSVYTIVVAAVLFGLASSSSSSNGPTRPALNTAAIASTLTQDLQPYLVSGWTLTGVRCTADSASAAMCRVTTTNHATHGVDRRLIAVTYDRKANRLSWRAATP